MHELEEASYEQWADFLGKARQVQMALRDHVQLAGTIEEVEKLSKEVLCKEHICDLGAAVSAWYSLEDSAHVLQQWRLVEADGNLDIVPESAQAKLTSLPLEMEMVLAKFLGKPERPSDDEIISLEAVFALVDIVFKLCKTRENSVGVLNVVRSFQFGPDSSGEFALCRQILDPDVA